MHQTSRYHCSKDTSVFLGVASPLKVLIWVPILSPAINMLRSQLTSEVSWGGLTGHGTGLPSLHSPSLLGSTSLSSVTTSLSPPGALWFPWGNPIRGAAPSLWVILVQRASSTSCSWSLLRSQTSLVSSTCCVDALAPDSPSSGLGMLGRGQIPTPLPCICIPVPEGWLPLLAIYYLTCPYPAIPWLPWGDV